MPASIVRRYPHQLSGGQAQRLVLALALAPRPALLLADEPTSALDGDNAARVVKLLRDVARELGTAVLMASHEEAVLRQSDRVIGIRAGRLCDSALPFQRALPSPPSPNVTDAPVLRFDSVQHVYRSGSHRAVALADVSFVIHRGETLALLGESGSGKSTAARIAVGLLQQSGGHVLTPATSKGRAAAMVFQDPRQAFDPRWTVRRSVAEHLPRCRSVGGEASEQGVGDLLRRVGLAPEITYRHPENLSLGQLQRAALARALAAEPRLLVCDEPTSALDSGSRRELLTLLRELQERLGFAMLFVTHDPAAARAIAHRAIILARGRLVANGPAATLLS